MVESLVNELTGETSTPTEYIASLRRLEREVTRMDDVLTTLKAEVKVARQGRDKAVAELRAAIREIKARSRGVKRKAGQKDA